MTRFNSFVIYLVSVVKSTQYTSSLYNEMINRAVDKMKQEPTQFVNFQHVVAAQFLYVVFLAFLVAAIFLRMLNLAGYSVTTARVRFVTHGGNYNTCAI